MSVGRACSDAGLWNNHNITHPYTPVGCSFNSCDYTASYIGSSIKGVNMETCLSFIMNNLSYILSAATVGSVMGTVWSGLGPY